jgi:Xaa-Pro aminopeptidase
MYTKRLEKVKKSLVTNKIGALIISSPININYLTGYSNFSREEREAYLLVTSNNATLFTDQRYIEAVEKIIPPGINATIRRPVTKKINQIVKRLKIAKIGFENNLTFSEYQNFKKIISAKLVLTNYIVEQIRSIKGPFEIELLKKAAGLTDSAFDYVKPLIKKGVTEIQIAYEIEKYIRKYGGTLAFDSIVAFGANASIPHHITSSKKLADKDEFVLLDFGAKVEGYCADMTRTLLTKKSSGRAKNIYKAVLEAQKNALLSITVDVKGNASNAANAANNVLKKHGFEKVPHGLGHGIGLEVHEEPFLHPKMKNLILTSGNYFSIEPGIYIPGFGGVRIEDDYLIVNESVEQLTKSPKNPY